jgi:hypothetical protein
MDFGSFLTLLGAIWVTFVPFADTVKTLNEIRDKVLTLGPTYSLEHRSLMLPNDWVPIRLAAVFQQGALTVLLAILPFIAPISADNRVTLAVFCYVLALFAAMRSIGFLITYRRDHPIIVRHLASLSFAHPYRNTPASGRRMTRCSMKIHWVALLPGTH